MNVKKELVKTKLLPFFSFPLGDNNSFPLFSNNSGGKRSPKVVRTIV